MNVLPYVQRGISTITEATIP